MFIKLQDFVIDRVASTAPAMIDNLVAQQNEAYRLVEEGEMVKNWSGWTDFAYQHAENTERNNVAAAIINLLELLPYVMTLNERLKSLTVRCLKDSRSLVFQRSVLALNRRSPFQKILVDGQEQRIYMLSVGNTIIILPVQGINQTIQFSNTTSRLFLYFPLIGTEDFGINFLIHSKDFAPLEGRDGVHLRSKNPATQDKEDSNRKIFQEASEVIFRWVESVAGTIGDPINLARIEFSPQTTGAHLLKYLDEQRISWVGKFRTFKLVETTLARIAPKDTLFFSVDLIGDKDRFAAIYSISAALFDGLPLESIAIEWTNCVLRWRDENLRFLDIDGLAAAIAAKSDLTGFDAAHLKQCYEYFIDQGRADVFSKRALLPNTNGRFHQQSVLHSYSDIDKVLIEIASVLMPDVLEKYVHDDFLLPLPFSPYDRKQYSKDINSKIGEIGKLSDNQAVDSGRLYGVVRYCRVYSAVDNAGVRGRLMPLVSGFYGLESEVISLPNIAGQELEWLTAFKWMVQIFFNDLFRRDSAWIEGNTSDLHQVLKEVHNSGDLSDKVESMAIFPNQLFELCKQSVLKVDQGIPDDLKDLYNTRIMNGNDIRSSLVLNGFEQYLKVRDLRTGRNLGDELEDYYLDRSLFDSDVNKHPHKDEIFNIIGRITGNGDWKAYFTIFEERKANILLSRVSDSEMKNDLFKIIGLAKDKIAALSEISGHENLERIIELGKAALEREGQQDSDFQWKYQIGKNIENLVREKLKGAFAGVRIDDAQAGQDIVIYVHERPVYYVEVKSRWKSDRPITMSPVQLEKSVREKEQYALCCVDLADYRVGEVDRFKVVDIDQVLDKIYFLDDIGIRVAPLIERNLAIRDVENEISLSGDYRATIPQSISKNGKPTDVFCYQVVKVIEKALVGIGDPGEFHIGPSPNS